MIISIVQVGDIMETIEINNFNSLPCGDNLNQVAAIAPTENGIEYEIISKNNNLEYIDYLNLTRAVEILGEFFDVNAISLAKENMLCAAALGSNLENALEKIIECDPLSITGGTIGTTKEVSAELAKTLRTMKIRNIIAPLFSKEAIKELENESINIVKLKSPLQELLGFNEKDIKTTPFGYLIQEQNHSKLTKASFKPAGKVKPNQTQAEDAIFAWKIAKYTKTCSAVIAKDLSTKAIVQSCKDLETACELAMDYACEASKEAVLAVDNVIENEQIINTAIQGRIGLIIESGNGINSSKMPKLTDKYNIALIQTGIRNNKY